MINWAAPEAKDAYKQHLAKIETILAYLETLTPKTPEDLVLIVDGYDVWFQLRPDVLLKRYYAMNEVADRIARETYGEELAAQYNMTQTVVFGPDKICWPIDYKRPACWTMPKGTLGDYAFGPDSDYQLEEHNLARWLNSGTILGPIEDMREVFRATLAEVHRNHTTDSDQFYFSNVYGEQEYSRLAKVPELMEAKMNETFEADNKEIEHPQRDHAEIERGKKVEYHIGLDWDSAMFQTMAYYKQFLVWMKYSELWKPSGQQKALDVTQQRYAFDLPQDVLDSAPPFEAINLSPTASPHHSELYNQSWYDTHLLVNTITRLPPVVLHYTGLKGLRAIWWDKLWFYSDAEALRTAVVKQPLVPLSDKPIGGRIWWGAEKDTSIDEVGVQVRGGGWSDAAQPEYLTWESLCAEHEDTLYGRPVKKDDAKKDDH